MINLVGITGIVYPKGYIGEFVDGHDYADLLSPRVSILDAVISIDWGDRPSTFEARESVVVLEFTHMGIPHEGYASVLGAECEYIGAYDVFYEHIDAFAETALERAGVGDRIAYVNWATAWEVWWESYTEYGYTDIELACRYLGEVDFENQERWNPVLRQSGLCPHGISLQIGDCLKCNPVGTLR